MLTELFRRCAIRAIAGCLFVLGISAAALSQQIPCPVTGTTINAGAATNALNPCEITAGATLTNSSSGTLENQAGATLLNDSGATLINNSTLSGSLLNDPGATITNNGLLTNNGFITSGSSPTMISTINNTGTFNGTGTIFTSGTVNNSGNFNNALFTFAATINNTGGTLVLSNGSTINGGTLNNVSGFLGVTGSGTTVLLDGSTVDGMVTIQGTYSGDVGTTTQLNGTINNQGNIQVTGNLLDGSHLTLNGDTTLLGGGAVTLVNNSPNFASSLDGSHVLTNVDNTIQGTGLIGDSAFGSPTLVNEAGGTINANTPGGDANVPGTTLTIHSVTITNAGMIEATNGGLLVLDSGTNLTNNSGGTIRTDAISTLTNNGVITNGSGGTINNAGTFNGTGMIFTSGTVNNSGNFNNDLFTFGATINNTGGTLLLANGSTINGGTLNNVSGTLGTNPLGTTVLLNGLPANGAVIIQGTYTNSFETTTQVIGTINNEGNIQVNGMSSLALVGNTTLQGGGTVTLASVGPNVAAVLQGKATLNNLDNTIQGAGLIDNGNALLANQAGGTINANVSGQTLTITGGVAPITISNAGLMEATNGGILILNNSPLTNSGTVQVSAGSTLQTNAAFTQTGGKTQVDGTMTVTQGLNLSGGSVLGNGTIFGNVTLTGGTMQPGGPGTPGLLVLNNNYSQTNATFDELIGATGNGLLAVNGTSTLGPGALLNIDLLGGFTPTDGEMFTLMDYFSNSGEFANALSGTEFAMDGFDWTIDYNFNNANDIVLIAGGAVEGGGGGGGGTNVPEPSSLQLLLAALSIGSAYSLIRRTSLIPES